MQVFSGAIGKNRIREEEIFKIGSDQFLSYNSEIVKQLPIIASMKMAIAKQL